MTIDPNEVRRGLAQPKPACEHPTSEIHGLPSQLYCKKCGRDVPPPDEEPSSAMKSAHYPPTRQEVFPSAKRIDWRS